jgi:hypothetical protein
MLQLREIGRVIVRKAGAIDRAPDTHGHDLETCDLFLYNMSILDGPANSPA